MEKAGFFSGKRADFKLEKRTFPENTLCYVNQGYISMVKGEWGGGGKLAICNDVFLWGQLIIARNQPNDIETHECKKNETKLIRCIYDQTTGDFLELQKELAYNMLMLWNASFLTGIMERNERSCIHL